MTPSGFRKRAEAAFRRSNPTVKAPKFTWLYISPVCPYRGEAGSFRSGRVRVEAPGFRTTVMQVSVDQTTGSTMVR